MLQVGSVDFDRQGIADHANNLASAIQLNLKRSLEAIGVVGPTAVVAALAVGIVHGSVRHPLGTHAPLLHCFCSPKILTDGKHVCPTAATHPALM